MKNQEDVQVVSYPDWLEDLFIYFTMIYQSSWTQTMPDEVSRNLQKTIWRDGLQNYLPDTIAKAAKHIIRLCPVYPPKLGEMQNLCEQLAMTNRYNNNQIEYTHVQDNESEKNVRHSAELISIQKKTMEGIRTILNMKKVNHD